MPDSADLALYGWHKTATAMRERKSVRFGLTTNSLPRTFARRVVEMHLKGSRILVSPDWAASPPGGVPGSSGGAPESSRGTPESSRGTPESSRGTPESSGGAPESSGGAPESSGDTPESSGDTPE